MNLLTVESDSLECFFGASFYLSIGEVEVIAHFHGQRAPAAAAKIHDAVFAAAV